MNGPFLSVWDVIKRFLCGWFLTFFILLVVSCVKYHEFIGEAVGNNMWALFNAVMPLVLIIGAILYMIRSVFR